MRFLVSKNCKIGPTTFEVIRICYDHAWNNLFLIYTIWNTKTWWIKCNIPHSMKLNSLLTGRIGRPESYCKTDMYWSLTGLFRLCSGWALQKPIWASGVPKLWLLSHNIVYWGLAIRRMKTRISPCEMTFPMFSGTLNLLVLSSNVKNISFTNGKSIARGNCF